MDPQRRPSWFPFFNAECAVVAHSRPTFDHIVMGNRRDTLPQRHGNLFHECWHCHNIGLKQGILATKHGDYGMRNAFKDEPELKLNQSGLCENCALQLSTDA